MDGDLPRATSQGDGGGDASHSRVSQGAYACTGPLYKPNGVGGSRGWLLVSGSIPRAPQNPRGTKAQLHFHASPQATNRTLVSIVGGHENAGVREEKLPGKAALEPPGRVRREGREALAP